MNRLISLLLITLLPLTASASADSARAQFEHFTEGLHTIEARFEQTVTDGQGMVTEQSTGEVFLRNPDQFRWNYEGDFPQQIVADGEHVWIHDVALEQVSRRDQATAASDSPLLVLTGRQNLDEQFDVAELGEVRGEHLLELRPRAEGAQFERILLGLDNNNLQSMVLEDAFGSRTEIRFTELVCNQPLEAGLFEFEAPEGIDVIGGDEPGD